MDSSLQQEIYAWHRRNYPKDNVIQSLLGIEEEIGELNRAELKQFGNIRGSWESWQEEKKKEIGDVLIGLLNYCGFCGVDFNIALQRIQPVHVFKNLDQSIALLWVSVAFGKLVENFFCGLAERRASCIGLVYRDVELYCKLAGFDVDEILAARWATISQRDFIANPETGGREKE